MRPQNGTETKSVPEVTVILGAQWGDEGKGKLVDTLGSNVDVVARCQGGNNAGHTVVVDGVHYHFHLLPGGLIHQAAVGIIGNGCVVNIPQLFDEIDENEKLGMQIRGRLFVSDRAHIVFDFHQAVDGMHETEKGKQSIGTTRKGIGPTYSSKAHRNGIRIGDLVNGDFATFEQRLRTLLNFHTRLFPSLNVAIEAEVEKYKTYRDRLKPLVCDTIVYLHKALQNGKRVLVEGANALLLDIDFGTYPYVTSSNCSIGGVCTGLGLPPRVISNVYGVLKAYTTRVGDGPFPTELHDELGSLLQKRGGEIGVTTKRVRRCGWLDLVMLRYSALINGYTALCLTKLDILDVFDEIKIGVAYHLNGERLEMPPSSTALLADVTVEYVTFPGWKTSTERCHSPADLPQEARNYISTIEQLSGTRIQYVGVGKSRDDIVRLF